MSLFLSIESEPNEQALIVIPEITREVADKEIPGIGEKTPEKILAAARGEGPPDEEKPAETDAQS